LKYEVFFRFFPPIEIENWAKNNVQISFAPSYILILPPPGKNPADVTFLKKEDITNNFVAQSLFGNQIFYLFNLMHCVIY